MSPFVAGMPVLCINDNWRDRPRLPASITWPVAGWVYTVRTVGPGVVVQTDEVFLRLREIVNPPIQFNGYPLMEPQFNAACFRPLTKSEVTIEALKRITPDTRLSTTLDPNPLRILPVRVRS